MMHPYVIAKLISLAADTELKAVQTDMRRKAIKSLNGQSGASRMKLEAERNELYEIAKDFRTLLRRAEEVMDHG